MAIQLDATVGGAASNSYVSLIRGNTLMEQLPHAGEWSTDFTINKAQLFIHATRLIDRHFQFFGFKTAASQALEWPRLHVVDAWNGQSISSSAIPEFIEWATVEWAFALHQDAESDTNFAPGITRLRTPSYEAVFGGSGKRSTLQVVDDLLLPYASKRVRGMIRLMRA